MEKDVKEIVLEITSQILKLAGIGENLEENKKLAIENIENRKSLQKVFRINRKTTRRCKIFRKYTKSKIHRKSHSYSVRIYTRIRCRKSTEKYL